MSKRISELPAIAAATIAPATDVMELSDVSVPSSNKVTVANLMTAGLAAPPPIGGTTPNTGAFSTISASGLITANGGVSSTNLISSTNVRSSSNAGIFSIGSANDFTIVRLAAGSGAIRDSTTNAAALTLGQVIDANKQIAGATGAVTQNCFAGQVQFAAAATSLVVTNALVTVNSVIVATVATADLNLKSVVAVAAAGSFTLTANTAPAATTKVSYHVIN